MDYQLVVLKGRSGAKVVRLADGLTTLGRQEGCELTVRSSQVSRKHCQLFEKKGLLLVKDLGSANGTFVNGKRIEEQRVLEVGDILMVGPIEFRIESLAGAPAADAAPAQPGGEVSSGTDERPRASDTDVPVQPTGSPIPLDDDDVLDFFSDDDEAPPAPAAKTSTASKPAAAKAPAEVEAEAKPAAKPKPKPKAKAKAKAPKDDEPTAEDEGANEAIAEFLMGIEVDEDDRA